MSNNKEPKQPSVFNQSSAQVLERGLNAMTRMCDVITKQNEILNEDVSKLKKKIDRMKTKLLENGLEDV